MYSAEFFSNFSSPRLQTTKGPAQQVQRAIRRRARCIACGAGETHLISGACPPKTAKPQILLILTLSTIRLNAYFSRGNTLGMATPLLTGCDLYQMQGAGTTRVQKKILQLFSRFYCSTQILNAVSQYWRITIDKMNRKSRRCYRQPGLIALSRVQIPAPRFSWHWN